jgi:two-component system sensor histidine kinase HydH
MEKPTRETSPEAEAKPPPRPAIPSHVAGGVLCAFVGATLSLAALPRSPSSLALGALFVACAALAVLGARAARAQTRANEAEIDRRANERHLASLGSMVAVLAHEIRNPLAALKGNAQLLAETTREDPKFRTRIDRVVKEAISLEQLTNDLLTFVRVGRLRRDATDVRVLVEQAIGVVQADVTLRAPETAVVAPIDRVRFLQAVDNLVRNATLHGKAPIEVEIKEDADAVRVTVRDHGKGIAEDRLERIFEPFETDATRGTGLGLAVVRRVAELHGGSAVAENAKDGGARFTLTFPRDAR